MCPVLAVLLLACGGAGEPEVEPGGPGEPLTSAEDGAPVIESVAVRPAPASARDALSASVRAHDPNGDPLAMEIEWYRNGALFESGTDTIEPLSFARGDRVFARARVTDGEFDVEADSPAIEIVNAAPVVTEIRIEPPEATATDMLIAEVQSTDADEDQTGHAYRWRVDGQVVEGAETARLAPGIARRGSTVVVEAQPTDGRDRGEWRASDPYRMGNAAPRITTQPVYELAASATYRYDVAATDPDGDAPLKYELIDGPPGMQVDISSGVVTWRVPQDVEGRFPIELVVSDPWGARTHQRYSLEVSWEPEQPSPAAAAPRAPGAPVDPDAVAGQEDEFAPVPVEPEEFEPDPIVPDTFDEDVDDVAEDDLEDDLDEDLDDDFDDDPDDDFDEDEDDFDDTPASDFEDDFEDDFDDDDF